MLTCLMCILSNFQLDWQSVAIPPRTEDNSVTTGNATTHNEVFKNFVDCMSNVRWTIRVWWTIKHFKSVTLAHIEIINGPYTVQ